MDHTELQLDDIITSGPESAKEWKGLNSLSFDATSVHESELIPMTLRLLVMHDLVSKFPITPKLWLDFMTRIKVLMHDVPYHNFQHICDVAQTTAVICLDPALASQLDDIDKFTIIISALLHDVDHPGKNNVYQVNASTDLAILYNDIAPLENHHASTSTKILMETGLLNVIPEIADRKGIRTCLIDFILATDMSKHFALSDELSKFLEKERTEEVSVSDRQFMMKNVLHMADISNPAKEWATSKIWSDRVVEEFCAQGDAEKEESLPVSPMCDREVLCQDEMSLGFSDFVVAPYLFKVAKLAPTVLVPACKVLAANRETWYNILNERLKNVEEQKEKLQSCNKSREAFIQKLDTFLAEVDAKGLQ